MVEAQQNEAPSSASSATSVADPQASVIQWLPWQDRFFRDKARVLVGCAHRQSGKDFVAAGKAVDDALLDGDDWFIVSLTQRQADATFRKCEDFAKALKLAAKLSGEITMSEREFVEYDKQLDQSFRCTARTLHLPGGGSVTALPGRDPDTLAGLTGNVIFTEFGLFPNGGYDHWRVVFPLSTRGYQVIVISTPRGRNTKFCELVSDPETYSVHFQTIEDSVREGFILRDNNGEPTDIETFKRLYGDESGWRREYMCEFTGDLEALIKWAQLQAAAEDTLAGDFEIIEITDDAGWDPRVLNGFDPANGRLEVGWDVARHSDLSSVWANQISPRQQGRRALRYLIIMRRCTFSLQREVVTSLMRTDSRNVGCGDASGLGMDSNETLSNRFGARWQPVTFTAKSKAELGSLARTAFDDVDQVIPPMDGDTKYVATDIYAVQADTSGDRLKLIETENPLLPESHCDIFCSFALCRMAAGIAAAQPFLSVH